MNGAHKFRFEETRPEVHVWSADLDVGDAQLAQLSAVLNPGELTRTHRFHFERDQRRFAAARGFLRNLLAGYLERSATDFHFGSGPRGKPFVQAEDGTPTKVVSFNVSHSAGRALFAFASGREVGIDLEAGERLGNDLFPLARRIFSARELAEFAALPPTRQREGFLNGWTRKEAFLKATGLGIVDGLPSIEITLGDPARLVSAGPTGDATAWTLLDLRSDPTFAAALVVQSPGLVLVQRLRYEDEMGALR